MEQESREGRQDRELGELLEELRVILPGVQVLFAFLLSVPFTTAFADVGRLQRIVYYAAFLCTAGAIALLIAPSAHHRLLRRQPSDKKEHRLELANRLTIAGTILLALAVTGVVFVASDVLFNSAVAAFFAAAIGGVFAWLWYALPLAMRRRH